MSIENIPNLFTANIFWILPLLLIISYLIYKGFKTLLARFSYSIAMKTENVYDDLFVDRLQPFRFAWLLPLSIAYFLAKFLNINEDWFITILLVLIIWFSTDIVIAILNGVNDSYKQNPRYSGVSVAGYIGILQVVTVVAAIVFTISILFTVDPITLLSGVGTWLAVLLLIFRDTILSFLASIQISTHKLIKEGDLVDIPAYGANGTITEIGLQTITVQNFDNTETIIPTSKVVDVGFKNFRVMMESSSRRLKKSLIIDVNTISFVNKGLLNEISKIAYDKRLPTNFLEGMTVENTNLQIFMRYMESYLRGHSDIRQRKYPFVVRVLDQTTEGLPVEFYVFVKANNWETFERIQAEIFIHFMAMLPKFGLKAYQA